MTAIPLPSPIIAQAVKLFAERGYDILLIRRNESAVDCQSSKSRGRHYLSAF